ncbi:hypothetical protein [Fulvimonas soli]|jgi:hypothetical protein|uniref:Uncharacterized protein n=1 Tax=Fulvimonas soli TaxID=155197 RepID=A0A316HW73_9GAMM|nr:hypothetical protein [Fulvimonas soli]PWK84378.1 hypothetical protein C7456_11156 [Fulvimonas soli]
MRHRVLSAFVLAVLAAPAHAQQAEPLRQRMGEAAFRQAAPERAVVESRIAGRFAG